MSYEECFHELKDEPESAAECIHCLKKHGENVIFSPERKRLFLERELYDESHSGDMKRISEVLDITTLERYREIDRKFNLTMY